MQGPLAAVVLLLELTHHADALMVPILIAVVEATVLARVLGAPSIYSARLSALPAEVHAATARVAYDEIDAKTAESEMLAPSDLLPITMHGPKN
jgi:hypothetical protein